MRTDKYANPERSLHKERAETIPVAGEYKIRWLLILETGGESSDFSYNKNMEKEKIYKLIDPNTNETRYIGKTSKSLQARLVGHLSDAYSTRERKSKLFLAKQKWIQQLLSDNKIPFIELIAEKCIEEASDFEKQCIIQHNGCDLFNSTHNHKYDPPASKLKKEIHQYSLEGKFIKTWASATDFAKYNNSTTTNINAAASGKRKEAQGYMWSYVKLEKLKPYSKELSEKEVHQYDKDGKYIKSYKSAAKAELDGFLRKNIYQCCSGEKLSHAFYQWNYDKVDNIGAISDKVSKSSRKAKPIYQIDIKTDKVVKGYRSKSHAAKELGISGDAIKRAANPRSNQKYAGGFKWVYFEDFKI